ncbi:MAG: integration host factor subunit beta [Desulfobacula sp.]|jgi:integration host factor subunit beta|uniref:HU family DNA-binding protein n=1 Tax=Desulfobacula sp. TaxID=2593537 RepID=UPI001DF9B3C2|nr:integration host factor subunit beta [Desulfobacula sp.]MBT3486492.1 integration host factor subunit beta [Desulfobacula sp.]MBT3806092.1 integration host factor subunit beta [Desulfobacula sp.]MBT4023754.1 integration host factor subunit beta [Desulfobacula sp.]MBT4197866.1 integration host factor subunit beta [Desulfobacula sp.]
MNKLKLIEVVKNRCSLTQKESIDLVNIFFSEIATTLAKGDRVEIRGLWAFNLKKYQSYTGRNPKTGKFVKVSSKKLPFFKCGKNLKERTDYPTS